MIFMKICFVKNIFTRKTLNESDHFDKWEFLWIIEQAILEIVEKNLMKTIPIWLFQGKTKEKLSVFKL